MLPPPQNAKGFFERMKKLFSAYEHPVEMTNDQLEEFLLRKVKNSLIDT